MPFRHRSVAEPVHRHLGDDSELVQVIIEQVEALPKQ
jgi:phenylpyruvate tautomerase PptA (4-oxalocrotonate tautomerase family)